MASLRTMLRVISLPAFTVTSFLSHPPLYFKSLFMTLQANVTVFWISQLYLKD